MLFVYMTAANAQEAQSIASFVVEERLASCANIFPTMHSIYHWKGKVERAEEAVCIFKTTEQCFEKLKATIVEKHSYETPCIVALPVSSAHEAFAAWVAAETLQTV